MRAFHVTVLAVLLATPAFAAPPAVEMPAEIVASSQYVTVVPKTDAKGVSYLGLSGVDPFPSAFLSDKKAFVLPTIGLKAGEYKFAGVASLNDEHTVFYFRVRVGPPVVVPPVDPPTNPPVTESLYFMIVRPDGPADPAFTNYMTHPSWAALRAKGHSVKDFTATDARALKAPLPAQLPCVLVSKTVAGKSVLVKTAPLPADPLTLLE